MLKLNDKQEIEGFPKSQRPVVVSTLSFFKIEGQEIPSIKFIGRGHLFHCLLEKNFLIPETKVRTQRTLQSVDTDVSRSVVSRVIILTGVVVDIKSFLCNSDRGGVGVTDNYIVIVYGTTIGT